MLFGGMNQFVQPCRGSFVTQEDGFASVPADSEKAERIGAAVRIGVYVDVPGGSHVNKRKVLNPFRIVRVTFREGFALGVFLGENGNGAKSIDDLEPSFLAVVVLFAFGCFARCKYPNSRTAFLDLSVDRIPLPDAARVTGS